AMVTQVIASSWYIVAVLTMRSAPWSMESFPLSAVPQADCMRAVLYAGISGASSILSFFVCRYAAVRWYGSIADPLTWGFQMYSEFASALFGGSMIGLMCVLYILLRPAAVVYFLYSNPG